MDKATIQGENGMSFKRTTKCIFRPIFLVSLALALAASAAQAEPDDPFTPRLSFSTTTDRAGANPDLTIEMQKDLRNHCVEPEEPTFNNPCARQYVEQSVKQMSISFPPGALPDANAAPYCDLKSRGIYIAANSEVFGCENDVPVGVVDITTQLCGLGQDYVGTAPDGCGVGFFFGNPLMEAGCNDPQVPPNEGWTYYGPQSPLPGDTYACRALGNVYNEAPRLDADGNRLEEGHLVILWPRWVDQEIWHPDGGYPTPEIYEPIGGYVTVEPTHVSVKVRKEDLGVDSISEVPDFLPGSDGYVQPGQPSDISLTLFGATGAERGHPLIANPTFCSPQSLDAEFLGYAHNSQPDQPGFGDGKTVLDSVGVQATNCAAVPYTPTFAAIVDSEAPGVAAALSTVITQKDDEATTKKVHVEFPKGMGVSINSTLKPCSAADLAVKSCPEVSKMGTVSAESRLLPKRAILGDSVKPEDEVLTGNVYLTGQEGDKLTLSALLSGFVDVRLDAKAGVSADGTVTATFDDLPPLPYSKFTLNLFGGSKGLLTNPRKCGSATTKATFTSHSGKTHTVETTSQVKGCSAPPELEFEVDLSNDGKGKRTAVEFDLTAQDRYIKKVTFGLPRYLKFSTKRLGKRKGFGSVRFETVRGELESSLSFGQSVRAKRKKKKAIRFSTKGTLNKLKVSLFKRKVGTKKVKIRTKSGKKKTLKRSVLKSRMSFKSLPKQDIKGLRVELNPSESRFLRNPKGCKKPLRFLAFVTTSDGKRHVLSQKVRLKGKGCSKKKGKKKK